MIVARINMEYRELIDLAEIIIRCIVVVSVGILLYYVIPFLKKQGLYDAVKIAVQAAEQIFTGTKMGAEKFAYVESWILDNFKVGKEELKNIIESTVYEMNNTEGN